jgi:hypothetical protein
MLGFDLEGRCRPFPPRSLRTVSVASPGRGAQHRNAQQSVVDSRARTGTDRAAQSVAVVGDQDRGARSVLVATGSRPAQIESCPLGSEHLWHGVEDGSQFRVAVAGALDGVGVEPERDVDTTAGIYVHSTVEDLRSELERAGWLPELGTTGA